MADTEEPNIETQAPSTSVDSPSSDVADNLELCVSDQLKHYQEGRIDVRSYAGFLIQVITLLLSSMIIVMGWVAKDYASEKYRIALQAAAPHLASTSMSEKGLSVPLSQLIPSKASERVKSIESDLDYVSSVYRHILVHSPPGYFCLVPESDPP